MRYWLKIFFFVVRKYTRLLQTRSLQPLKKLFTIGDAILHSLVHGCELAQENGYCSRVSLFGVLPSMKDMDAIRKDDD